MKELPVENLGFVEIGGVGEMVYRVVRFSEYVPPADEEFDGEHIVPLLTWSFPPKVGNDYNLNGQELLTSLCNLYRVLNDDMYHADTEYEIWQWCRSNVHPYNIEMLSELLRENPRKHMEMWDMIRSEGTFRIDDFIRDLCRLGSTFEFYYALRLSHVYHDASFAKGLYYEGRYCDGMAFLEKYKKYEDDAEYLAHIDEDYNDLARTLLYSFPDFRMRLKLDDETGKISYGADIDSVFDICWYTFSRMVADDAPPVDEDLNYMYQSGSVRTCMACGKYFVRHSGRQKYCQNPDCQAVRNRKNRNAAYERKKIADKNNDMKD